MSISYYIFLILKNTHKQILKYMCISLEYEKQEYLYNYFIKEKSTLLQKNDNAYTHIIFRNHLIKINITLPIANYFRSKRQIQSSWGVGNSRSNKPVFCVQILCYVFVCVLSLFKKKHLGSSSQFLAFGHLDKGTDAHLLK